MRSGQIQMKELERLLGFFDKDGDGYISAAELRACMEIVGDELSAEDAEAMMKSLDADGVGLVAVSELVLRLAAEDDREAEEERDLSEAFSLYENEGEGCITARSLKRMLSRLGMSRGMEQCAAMICRFDVNGDGVLSFEEFKIMMMMH